MFHRHSHAPSHRCRDDRGDGDRRHARGDFWPGAGHDRGFGHGRGAGRAGRLGRLFAHGDLHFVILHLTAEKPRHGYEIIKAIEDMVGGAYTPSPGTVYPALTMLEDQGHVSVEASEGNKKLYAVTEAGRAYLQANRGAVETLLARMAEANAAQGGEPAPQIVRAVQNLRLALHLRLAHGTLNDEQVRRMTEILDRAAAEIERS